MGPQEFEVRHTLHRHIIWMGWFVLLLLRLFCVEQQVVCIISCSEVVHFIPVGCLIIILDEINHCGVICKLNDGIRIMYRSAVMSEEGVDEWAHHMASWYAGV